MALTLTNREPSVFGNKRIEMFNAAFDSSYASGGESVTAKNVGLRSFDRFLIEPVDGYSFQYDHTNNKIKVFAPAPLIVYEESVALTSNTTGTTKYPMAWPLYASNGNQALTMMPKGMTPVTTTIGVNMHASTPGTRATLTALPGDTYTTITISYITQAWTEVFENLVEGETMVAGATNSAGTTFTAGTTPDVIAIQNLTCGIMVGLDLAGTMSCPLPIIKGATAVAGEYALDFSVGSTTTVSPVGTEVWDAATSTVYFNYIKLPSSGFLHDRFNEEDAHAAVSQIYTADVSGVNVLQPLLWSTPGFMPSVTFATMTSGTWPIGGSGMVLGATAQWSFTNYYMAQRLTTALTVTSGSGVLVTLAVKPSFVNGVPDEIQQTKLLEVPNGTDISTSLATVKCMAIGL